VPNLSRNMDLARLAPLYLTSRIVPLRLKTGADTGADQLVSRRRDYWRTRSLGKFCAAFDRG
jgi:hypothetical protein